MHLRAEHQEDGNLVVRWIRRTRLDGDSWLQEDVPIGEAFEAYKVRVASGGSLRREVTVTTQAWTYSAAEIAADNLGPAFTIEVAQISDRIGSGHFARIDING